MVRRADRDLELACDEAVVAAMDGAGRADYSRAILDAVEAEARVYAPLTSYFYGGKAAMLERLRGILDTEAKKRGVAVVVLATVATLSLTGAFSVTGQADREAVDGLVYSLRLPTDMTGKLKGSGDVWGSPWTPTSTGRACW